MMPDEGLRLTPSRAGPAALLAGGLVAVRVAEAGHAPALLDAICAACAAALVASGAPAWWPQAAWPAVVGAAASIALSRDPWQSLLSLSLVLGAVAFAALGADARRRDGVVVGLAVGGVVHSFAAIAQRFVLWPDALARRDELQLPPSIVASLASGRPLGLSLSPDLGAGLAIAAAAAALAVVVDDRRSRPSRIAAGLAVVPMATAVVLSRSFGAALAVGCALVVVAVARRAWRLLGALVGCAALTAAAVAARGADALVVSAHERLLNWRVGWAAFADAPATGHGLLRFAAAYAERRPPEANVTRYAHSAAVQTLAETGIVGALGVVVVLVVVVPLLVRALRGTAPAAALAGGAVALGARSLVDYDLHVGQTAMIAAALAGLAIAHVDDGGTRWPADHAAASWARPTALATLIAACALSLLLLWRGAATPGSPLARVDVEVALRHAVAQQDPAQRRALLAPFVDTTPAAAVVAARAALEQGDADAALVLLEQARARDPGLPAVHHLLVTLARKGLGAPDAREADARRYGIVVP
jgi:O-antigen ligase